MGCEVIRTIEPFPAALLWVPHTLERMFTGLWVGSQAMEPQAHTVLVSVSTSGAATHAVWRCVKEKAGWNSWHPHLPTLIRLGSELSYRCEVLTRDVFVYWDEASGWTRGLGGFVTGGGSREAPMAICVGETVRSSGKGGGGTNCA